jgi:hypothetical protein
MSTIGPQKKQSGQMTILITMIFLTLIILFAFVMNVGILISEKINLQNAADAGAYAGASMQARVLNKIAFLNYRLRQEWKEFSYHHWVTFQRSDVSHPVHWGRAVPDENNLKPFDESYNGSAPGTITAPCICIAGTKYRGQESNFCQSGCSAQFAGVREVVALYASPLVIALKQTTQELRRTLETEWNRLNAETENMAEEVYFAKYEKRTAALHQKIQNYVTFFNEIANVQDPSSAEDPISQTAFTSILKNLSFGNRENLSIRVLNSDADPAWLKLDTIEASLLLHYAKFETVGSDINRKIVTKAEDKKMIVGVSKDQNTVTYYALRLTSRPNLIYLPEHWEPVLIAYAAAKPFGARIGPHFSDDPSRPPDERMFDRHMVLANQAGLTPPPNFSFRDNDTFGMASAGQMDLFKRYTPAGKAEESQYPTATDQNPNHYGLLSVRSPNHFESMRYSIFTDPTKHSFGEGDVNVFETFRYPDGVENSPFDPIFEPDQGIRRSTLFSTSTPTLNGLDIDGAANDMTIDLLTLKNDPQGKNSARANAQQTRTAWCNDTEFEKDWGRVGYSVKLVSMNQLVSITFGGTPLENLPAGDKNVDGASSGRNIWH